MTQRLAPDAPVPPPGAVPGNQIDRLGEALASFATGVTLVMVADGRDDIGARVLLEGTPHDRGAASGALIAGGGLAALECAAVRRVPAGDHLLVIASVLAVPYVADAGSPLIRYAGRYPSLG